MGDMLGSMKTLADNIGKYVMEKIVSPKMAHCVSYYTAIVTAAASGGVIQIQRPYDTTTRSLPYAPTAANLQVGDMCTVMVFGNNANAFIISSGSAESWGDSIPFGYISSVNNNAFDAIVPGVTRLRDGVCAYIRNDNTNTSAAGWTLNVNGLGAKPVYQSMADASAVTTTFNKAYTMLFIYNSSRVAGGCWDMFYGYYSTTNYNIRDAQAAKTASSAIYRYMFVFTKHDGTLVPSCNTSNSTSTSKTLSTTAFNPFGPIYYYSTTTTVSSGSSPGASYLYTKYNAANMRYAWNVSTTSLTTKTPVYVRCAPQTDGSVKLDGNSCIVQALPSTADGKVYIFLGYAYSQYQIELDYAHPVYQYLNGKIQLWTGN